VIDQHIDDVLDYVCASAVPHKIMRTLKYIEIGGRPRVCVWSSTRYVSSAADAQGQVLQVPRLNGHKPARHAARVSLLRICRQCISTAGNRA